MVEQTRAREAKCFSDPSILVGVFGENRQIICMVGCMILEKLVRGLRRCWRGVCLFIKKK